MEVPVWLWQNVIGGVVAAALLALVARGYALLAKLYRTWWAREQAQDARAAARVAQDIYRLVIMVGVLLLVVLSTLCGGLGLALLVFRATTGGSWLYYMPMVLFFAALGFCWRGLNFLNQAVDHLNAGEALAKQAVGSELKA